MNLFQCYFGDKSTAKELRYTLVTYYDGNHLMKITRLIGLETRFETFQLRKDETVDKMYSKLTAMRREFIELGEPLSNNKIVGKMLRVMFRRPRWESLGNALETVQ